jgi:hypothetical protein
VTARSLRIAIMVASVPPKSISICKELFGLVEAIERAFEFLRSPMRFRRDRVWAIDDSRQDDAVWGRRSCFDLHSRSLRRKRLFIRCDQIANRIIKTNLHLGQPRSGRLNKFRKKVRLR